MKNKTEMLREFLSGKGLPDHLKDVETRKMLVFLTNQVQSARNHDLRVVLSALVEEHGQDVSTKPRRHEQCNEVPRSPASA